MTLVANRYEIRGKIGAGGMGTVFLGLDKHTGSTVAVKLLKSDVIRLESGMLERFRREGAALRDLNHPNIVKMIDAVQDGEDNYLILEYVPGGDLARLLKQGALAIKQVLKIAIDLSDALTRAHKLNIVHRDLKPANVLLAEDGTVRLTDFGVAYFGGAERMTSSKNVVGTFEYLAPEALQGHQINPRSDIWSFGILLFEMLARSRPFHAPDVASTITAILYNSVPDLEELCPDAPTSLIDLIYRMLEKDPLARISSVRHVGAALDDILHGRDSDSSIPVLAPDSRFVSIDLDTTRVSNHNLPAQTTDFVGRESELLEISRLYKDFNVRLVTILGPGGMGKTRLSIQIGYQFAGLSGSSQTHVVFEHGVYFVELAPLRDPAQIVTVIADATNYQFQDDGRDQKRQLLDYLSNKQLLLIIDNFEHLLDGASIVTEILNAAPDIGILVTSRQKLNQSSETIFDLEGMDFPEWETPADALDYAAVKLFLQSAKRVRPGFELQSDDLAYVARICRLVHGVPLGILLAASWLSMLSPSEIVEEIQQGLDFLESDMSDLPERHRSIRAVFDYSWNLMNEAERNTFIKLSIFRGGFTREAAQEIANASLRILMSLMNKSLIRRDVDTGRYTVHELLRQYAEEQLESIGISTEAHEAHSRYFMAYIQKQEPNIKGRNQLGGLNTVEVDFENIQGAWQWAVEQNQPQIVNNMIEGIFWYCAFRARSETGAKLMKLAQDQWPITDKSDAPLVAVRTYNRYPPTDVDPIKVYEQCLVIARAHSDTHEIAYNLQQLGKYRAHHLRDIDGIDELKESLALFESLDDGFYAAQVLDDIGWAYALIGDFDQRMPMVERSMELRQKIGDKIGESYVLRNLSTANWGLGNHQLSIEQMDAARQVASQMGDRTGLTWTTLLLGVRYALRDDFERGVPLIEEGTQLANDLSNPVLIDASLVIEGIVKGVESQYDTGMALVERGFNYENWEALDVVVQSFGPIALGINAVGLDQFDLVEIGLHYGMQLNLFFGSHPMGTWFVPIYACLLAHEGERERAIGYLAIGSTHPLNDCLYMQRWKYIADLKHKLKSELGEAAYDAAWEGGKARPLAEAVDEMRTRFADRPA